MVGSTIGGGGLGDEFCGPGWDEACTHHVSADWATIGGGFGNTISQNSATIGGGNQNAAADLATTIGGGSENFADGREATIGGGYTNSVDGIQSTIGGGLDNAITANWATIGGGDSNHADALYATVPGGHSAQATHYGEHAYASGLFGHVGDAQTSVYVLRNQTLGTTPAELFLNGSDQRLTIAPNRTVTFDILLAARSWTGGSIGCTFQGVIENNGGTTAFVMAPGKLCQKGGLTWDAILVADDTNDALQIQVTGAAGVNIRWVARVQTVEVTY